VILYGVANHLWAAQQRIDLDRSTTEALNFKIIERRIRSTDEGVADGDLKMRCWTSTELVKFCTSCSTLEYELAHPTAMFYARNLRNAVHARRLALVQVRL